MKTKQCNACKLTKELIEFHTRKTGVLGRRSECIACEKERGKKYRLENKDKLKQKQKEYYYADVEKSRKQQLARYYKHRDERMAYMKKYREKNKDKLNANARADYYANYDHYRAKWKEYYENNKEFVNNLGKKWREKNVEKIIATDKKRAKELTDSYVRSQLLKRSKIKIDIPQEFIEVKRLQIKIWRIANEKY
jgi:hypothetical protein